MLQRIGVSLEETLLEKFDDLINQKGYTNRSEAIRDLIRERLVQKEWDESDSDVMAVILMVFDHHQFDLGQRLTDKQHEHHELIISTLHVHMDHQNCLEILLLKGKAQHLRSFAEKIISVRGVKFGKFVPTTTGQGL